MNRIKSCPFCGSVATLISIANKSDKTVWGVTCMNCPAMMFSMGNSAEDKSNIADSWNKRDCCKSKPNLIESIDIKCCGNCKHHQWDNDATGEDFAYCDIDGHVINQLRDVCEVWCEE